MSDTKISALTAAASAATANEYAINEAGTSKKVTGAQIKTLVNTAPVFAAGTASANTAPKLTSGTVNTTPEAGALEYDGKVFYGSSAASCRGVIGTEYFIRLTSTHTLANVGTEQALFDSVGTGALTLPTGLYFFDCQFSIASMSSTTGNINLFDLLGAGTATLTPVHYHFFGTDSALNGFAAAGLGSSLAAEVTGTNLAASATNANCTFFIRGSFSVTATGTIIPSIALTTAAAAVVQIGSHFKCHCAGAHDVVTVGQWS